MQKRHALLQIISEMHTLKGVLQRTFFSPGREGPVFHTDRMVIDITDIFFLSPDTSAGPGERMRMPVTGHCPTGGIIQEYPAPMSGA
jgi:hypothetical protein